MPLRCVMEGEPVGRYWMDVGTGEKEEPGIQAIMYDSLSPITQSYKFHVINSLESVVSLLFLHRSTLVKSLHLLPEFKISPLFPFTFGAVLLDSGCNPQSCSLPQGQTSSLATTTHQINFPPFPHGMFCHSFNTLPSSGSLEAFCPGSPPAVSAN